MFFNRPGERRSKEERKLDKKAKEMIKKFLMPMFQKMHKDLPETEELCIEFKAERYYIFYTNSKGECAASPYTGEVLNKAASKADAFGIEVRTDLGSTCTTVTFIKRFA